jgi:hypothetical protein
MRMSENNKVRKEQKQRQDLKKRDWKADKGFEKPTSEIEKK